jgi:hypothetical protein
MQRIARRLVSHHKLFAVALIGAAQLWGQGPWTGGPTGPISYSGGNVGIGTTSPGYPLTVSGNAQMAGGSSLLFANSSSNNYVRVYNPNGSGGASLEFDTDILGTLFLSTIGNVGVGTTAPATPLHINSAGSGNKLLVSDGTPANARAWIQVTAADSGLFSLADSGGVERIRFNATPPVGGAPGGVSFVTSGALGIGTTNPCINASSPSGCLLSVAGAIQAYEVVVNANWSDYVFSPGYRVKPLSEVAAYIDENHHLPDIPTEAEVKEKGVSLGEMQSKLLAKIEELTLHMIQAEERNDRLEQQNRELQQRVARMEQPAAAGQVK